MQNEVYFNHEQISELLSKLEKILDLLSEVTNTEFFEYLDEFEKIYNILDDMNIEQKLSETESKLLNSHEMQKELIIENKFNEIDKLINHNVEESKNYDMFEDIKSWTKNNNQWLDYNGFQIKLLKHQLNFVKSQHEKLKDLSI